MSVWNDHMIGQAVESHHLVGNEYYNQINPASIDLRLGNTIKVPKWYWGNPITRYLAWISGNRTYWNEPFQFTKYVLWPGRFVLCHSAETMIVPDNAKLKDVVDETSS